MFWKKQTQIYKKRLVTYSILISGLLWQFNHKRCSKCSYCSFNCERQGTTICCIANRLDVEFTSIKYLQTIDNYTLNAMHIGLLCCRLVSSPAIAESKSKSKSMTLKSESITTQSSPSPSPSPLNPSRVQVQVLQPQVLVWVQVRHLPVLVYISQHQGC